MKTKRYYTNAEKIEYFKRRIQELENPEKQQDWNERVTEEILETKIANILERVLARQKKSEEGAQ